MNRSLPKTMGENTVEGLADSVYIYRDGYHIPHILATNDFDLWFMQGYVTAQDRFFQLDYWRHLSSGNLSFLVGTGCAYTDSFMNYLDIENIVDALILKISPEDLKIYQAYVNGVNAYLNQNYNQLPLEYQVCKNKPDKWSVEDCLAVFICYSFFMRYRNIESFILQVMADRSNLKSFQKYLLWTAVNDSKIRNVSLDNRFIKQWEAARKESYLPNFISESRVCVVPESLTTTRKSLIALSLPGLYSLPVLYYEIHLYSPVRNAAGFSLPGFPGILCGYNFSVVWSLLNHRVENTDEYKSVNNNSEHRTRHLLGINYQNDPGKAIFHISQAHNAVQGDSILRKSSMPGLHWVCADTYGVVVYSQHKYDSLYSGKIPYWFDQRLRKLLRSYSPVSIIDCQKIQMDNQSVLAEHLLPQLLHSISEQKNNHVLYHKLDQWDKNMRIGDEEAIFFETWIRKLAENIFSNELDSVMFESLMSSPGLWQSSLVAYLLDIKRQQSNDQKKSINESIEKIIRFSFQEAIEETEKKQGRDISKWSWGRIHTLTYRHLLSEIDAFEMSRSLGIRYPLLMGPYSLDGCYASISGNSVDCNNDRFSAGTVARMIVDLNDLDNTISIISTGQSGQMNDTHYQDQIPLFTRGYYHPNLFTLDKIKRAGWSLFIATPAYSE
ncbi:penicillin acylase family protein [bacterium]|nr:penicillin acylase family protein [bacterium]